ncbi:hypothetical protein PD5205_03169 [Xanthomonas fragariae]|uniref:Uncharacterized protein n=2 Tax=Xanthomonas fragariae TaxID=48664 RepID=A0A1Y6H3K5_9XANT|nr:hypothetical protein PD885_00826 [Xanthomonas fragariae]SMR04447.1 hypothetical protein PD5205_03169 [Xanthomonas fragariae]
MVILECRAAVTDGTWRLTGIFQGRLNNFCGLFLCPRRMSGVPRPIVQTHYAH